GEARATWQPRWCLGWRFLLPWRCRSQPGVTLCTFLIGSFWTVAGATAQGIWVRAGTPARAGRSAMDRRAFLPMGTEQLNADPDTRPCQAGHEQDSKLPALLGAGAHLGHLRLAL